MMFISHNHDIVTLSNEREVTKVSFYTGTNVIHDSHHNTSNDDIYDMFSLKTLDRHKAKPRPAALRNFLDNCPCNKAPSSEDESLTWFHHNVPFKGMNMKNVKTGHCHTHFRHVPCASRQCTSLVIRSNG